MAAAIEEEKAMGESSAAAAEWDIHALFCHYNALYFHDALGACVLSWSQSPRCTGSCHYHPEGGCDIYLSEPLLKFHSTSELKNALLHEMIHAFLWIEYKIKDHSDHGPRFQTMMKEINSSSVIDHQRPAGGYNITTYHEILEELDGHKIHRWICKLCGDLVKRTRNREPSASDCPDKMGHDASCGNSTCQWHRHKKLCPGKYVRFPKDGTKDEKMGLKGDRELQQESKRNESILTTRISCKTEGKKEMSDGKMLNMISNLFLPADDANRNSGDSLADMDLKKLNREAPKGIESLDQHTSKPPETSKRVCARTRQKHKCISLKKRKFGKCKQEFTVMSAWLGMYLDEEADEEVEPLINVRTERRKKLKLLKDLNRKTTEIDNVDDMTEMQGIPMDIGNVQEPASTRVRAKDSTNADISDAMNCDEPFPVVREGNLTHPNISEACGVVKRQDGSVGGATTLSSYVRDNVVDISD